ncbi:MAG: ribonuclease H-like domain-containing protein [Methanoregulaceae archaeon]
MQSESLLAGIGSRWQNRVASLREYDVIREGNVFGTSFTDSFLYQDEFDCARRLRDRLLEEYGNRSFGEVFPGKIHENDGGECTVLTSREEIAIPLQDPEALREAILSDLTLVKGIGPRTAERLRKRGFTTIPDLTGHARYRVPAREFLQIIEEGDRPGLMAFIARRHSASHPHILGMSTLFPPESLVFFDIETLGLFSRPIILFGVGRIEGGHISVSQYLLEDPSEEHAALLETLTHLTGENPALVTFNGKSFDLPYFRDRLAYYGTPFLAGIPHFDILHHSRRSWKNELKDCRLGTLEREILGIQRSEDLPSQMVPEFYETYLETGNPGPLVPIVEHNRQDVVSLARLYALHMERWNAGS